MPALLTRHAEVCPWLHPFGTPPRRQSRAPQHFC